VKSIGYLAVSWVDKEVMTDLAFFGECTHILLAGSQTPKAAQVWGSATDCSAVNISLSIDARAQARLSSAHRKRTGQLNIKQVTERERTGL
jgi:hypothetical protein